MKYGDYKTVIVVKSGVGIELFRVTTWRKDIVTGIIEGTKATFDHALGQQMTITIKPAEET